MEYKTEQEKFWSGAFGDEYARRNQGGKHLAANSALYAKILAHTYEIGSVIEFGANIGMNIQALRNLLPDAEFSAIEIHGKAAAELRKIPGCAVYETSILEFEPSRLWDFVLIKGVLIHIDPGALGTAYDKLYRSSRRYICVAEYYNPTPVDLDYRGHRGKMFKRDFAGEMLDRYPDLKLVDYGFVYHRDLHFPKDDINWFLLEKAPSRSSGG